MSTVSEAGKKTKTRAADIRSKLGHPVVDADGHALEFGPVYFEYLKQVAGQDTRYLIADGECTGREALVATDTQW